MGAVVSDVVRAQRAMRFRGRSYMAFVLTPELPIADWLTELDEWIKSSAGYFVGRPVVLDLSAVALSRAESRTWSPNCPRATSA